jgi:16S rRNA (cytidine1402-2'-O)-methyltransferase
LRDALATADVIAAEDTRRAHRLLADLGITTAARMVSFFDSVERERSQELIAAAESGATVLVVTDAGMPSVSDPGFRLVTLAVERGIAVSVLPGPSAVLAALAMSGLPVDRFCFEGFLPRQAGPRRARLTDLASEPRTMVFFEAPHRAAATLASMRDAWGPGRRAAACRELTKVYEEVFRGTLDELCSWADGGLRGELTIVVAGIGAGAGTVAASEREPAALARAVAEAEAGGLDRRTAITEVAVRAGVPRKVVYQAVIDARSAT